MSIGTWKKTQPTPLLLPVRFGSIVVNFFRFAQTRILPVRTEPLNLSGSVRAKNRYENVSPIPQKNGARELSEISQTISTISIIQPKWWQHVGSGTYLLHPQGSG